MEMVLRSPVFTGAKHLTLRVNFESYNIPFFRRFPDLVTLEFDEPYRWAQFTSFLRELVIEGVTELFPVLKCIIVSRTSAPGLASLSRGLGDDLSDLEKSADAILTYFGERLAILGITGYSLDQWEEGDAALAMLRDKQATRRRCRPIGASESYSQLSSS